MAALEQNKNAVRLAYDKGMSRSDIDFLDQVFTQDYVVRFPGLPPIKGLPAAKQAIGEFLQAFPATYTIEDIFAEGDRVVARWTAKGVHKGEFRGISDTGHVYPPTGLPVEFGATDIYRLVDGKVAEEWNSLEHYGLLVQIGALKLD